MKACRRFLPALLTTIACMGYSLRRSRKKTRLISSIRCVRTIAPSRFRARKSTACAANTAQPAQPPRTWACRTDCFGPPGPQRVHIHCLSDLFSSAEDNVHIVSAWNAHLASTYHLLPATTGTSAPFSPTRMDQIERQLARGGVQTARVQW